MYVCTTIYNPGSFFYVFSFRKKGYAEKGVDQIVEKYRSENAVVEITKANASEQHGEGEDITTRIFLR